MKRHYYVCDYNDEVVPCEATLEAWAAWLAADDADWPHEAPADGETFKVSTIDELASIRAVRRGGEWHLESMPPEGADSFVCRNGRTGWDAETWASWPQAALNALELFGGEFADGEEDEVVCTREGPTLICRFHAEPPHLEIVGEVQ